MTHTALPDTTLCMIVRDEMMNPAGGIGWFLEVHLPFVSDAIILDTGSKDGTREYLEEAQGTYPRLRVFGAPFEGYAQSRNRALAHVKRRRALVLDADERLTAQDFGLLNAVVSRTCAKGYSFDRLNIYPAGDSEQAENHNPRLFDVEGVHYRNTVHNWAEYLFRGEVRCDAIPQYSHATGLFLKHIRPELDAVSIKFDWLYNPCAMRPLALPEVPGFSQWKKYNPREQLFM